MTLAAHRLALIAALGLALISAAPAAASNVVPDPATAKRAGLRDHVMVPVIQSRRGTVVGGTWYGEMARSPAARDIVAGPSLPQSLVRIPENPEAGEEEESPIEQGAPERKAPAATDPALTPAVPGTAAPPPTLNFEGIDMLDNGATYGVPDTNGAVGANDYVQAVNASFAVWSKTGAQRLVPTPIRSLFANLTGPCHDENAGDPVVVYDDVAARWIITQFTTAQKPSANYQCVAVSTTSDPTGTYYTWAFQNPAANAWGDYPKWATWSDGYYLTTNEFAATGSHPVAFAFDRNAMLAGQSTIKWIYTTGTANGGVLLLPAESDGTVAPPAGDLLLGMTDNARGYAADALLMYKLTPDFSPSTPTGTYQLLTTLSPAAFDSILCDAQANCVGQPNGQYLQTMSDRLMFRLAYRNFGDHESMVVTHTVDRGGEYAAPRWYELRRTGTGSWTIAQQATWWPESATATNKTERWMGSVAIDRDGDIALGYSVSSDTIFPSIRYAGRLASDPAATLAQGEATLFTGSAALGAGQVSDDGRARWGDYSAMTVDPSDGCTFWYTQMYWRGMQGWGTRIGSFRFPSCAAAGADHDPPANPALSSSNHTVNRLSNDPELFIDWSPATDPSGIDGYAAFFGFDAPAAVPAVKNIEFGQEGRGLTVDEDGNWWYSLRTADKAGNWSAQTNLGPFPIDITAPQNPTLHSPDHTVGTPSSAPVVAVDVSGASDGFSGVSGYSWSWTASAATSPDASADGPSTTSRITSDALATGSWWLHLRTADKAGNWSAPVHLGPFVIVAAPSATATPTASPAPTAEPTPTPTPSPTGGSTNTGTPHPGSSGGTPAFVLAGKKLEPLPCGTAARAACRVARRFALQVLGSGLPAGGRATITIARRAGSRYRKMKAIRSTVRQDGTLQLAGAVRLTARGTYRVTLAVNGGALPRGRYIRVG